jgi:preprotein translocase SecE subunit
MAEAKNSQPNKRRVKNPETFRERANKSSTKLPKTNSPSKASSALSKVFKPIRKSLKSFFSSPVFRIFRLPLKILSKVLLLGYFAGSLEELKQVTWPSWPLSRRLTYAVLSFAIVFGASIAGVDWVLGKIFKNLLLK